jgi:uncharacterized membrane protein YeaQ/YmgE (transglycosylase-associated protein family)
MVMISTSLLAMPFSLGNVSRRPDHFDLLICFVYKTIMTLLDLLILLIVAGICGALGQAITGFSRGGCLVSIALGFVGAVVGMWLARALGLPELFAVRIGTTNFPIVWSIIGSALFVAVIALLTRRSY